MTPEQFFGRNIGAKVKFQCSKKEALKEYGIKDSQDSEEIINSVFKGGWLNFDSDTETSYLIDHCQIIGRRIKDIPDTLYNVLAEDYGLCHEGAFNKCLISDITMQIEGWELLFDKGYFPNEYFDEFKWCVEAEK